jgi:hypothetical protein
MPYAFLDRARGKTFWVRGVVDTYEKDEGIIRLPS